MRNQKAEASGMMTGSGRKSRGCRSAKRAGVVPAAPSTDVAASLEAALALVSSRARARRVRILCDASDIVRVEIEALDLIALLDGLLTNAIVRTPVGGEVELRLIARDREVSVVAVDGGARLTTHDLNRLLWPQTCNVAQFPGESGLLDSRWTEIVRRVDRSRIEGRSLASGAAFKLTLPVAG